MSLRRVLREARLRCFCDRGKRQLHICSVVNNEAELVHSCLAFNEQSDNPSSDPWSPKGYSNLVNSFLKEQRHLFNEFLCHLKDERILLSSIEEDLGLQSATSEIRKPLFDESMRLQDNFGLYFVTCKSTKEADETVESIISHTQHNVCMAEELHRGSEQESTMISECSTGNGADFSEEKGKSSVSTATEGAGANRFQHPSWPEWATFLSRLRPFARTKSVEEDFKLFEDTTILKRAIVKFAQAHEGLFGSLSQENLCMLVRHDFPSMDEKTATGKKKLELYLKADSSKTDKLFLNKVPRPKLTDVVRVLYRAVRSMPSLGGALPRDLSISIINILQDFNTASSVQLQDPVSIPKGSSLDVGQTVQGSAQQTQPAEIDEDQSCGDICRTINGEEALQSDKNARSA